MTILETAGTACARIARAAVNHCGILLGIIGLLSVISVFELRHARMSGDVMKLYVSDQAALARHQDMEHAFGGLHTIVLAWSVADVLDGDVLATQRRVVEALQNLPAVTSVTSLATAPYIERKRSGGVTVTTWEQALAGSSGSHRSRLLTRLNHTPALRGLRGSTGRASLVLLQIPDLAIAESSQLISNIRDRVTGIADIAPGDLHLAGFPVAAVEALALVADVSLRVLPLVIGLLAIGLIVLYRSPWPAVLALAVGVPATLWAMAAGVALAPEIGVPRSAAPVLILLLCLSNIVFIVHEWRRIAHHGFRGSREDLAVTVMGRVGPAALLSAASTLLGLASLTVVDAPGIFNLGFTAVVGVGSSLVLQLTLVPALLARLPAPSAPGIRFLATQRKCRAGALRYPIVTLGAAIAALVVAAAELPHLQVETRLSERFGPTHPIARAQAFLTAEGFGTDSVLLIVHAQTGSALNPDILADLAGFEDEVRRRFAGTSVLSIIDALRELRGLVHTQLKPDAPFDIDQARQALFLLPAGGRPFTEGQVSADGKALAVRVYSTSRGLLEDARIATEVESLARQQLGDEVEVEMTGVSWLLGGWLDDLHRTQLVNLAVLTLALFVALALAFGRFSLATLCILVNAAPLLVLAALFGWTDRPLDSDYLMVAMLGLGLLIDDSAHFITRYQRRARSAPNVAAIVRAHAQVAPPILHTSLLLVLGLAPLQLTGYLSLTMWSSVLTMLLAAALLFDLVALPAGLRALAAHTQRSRL